MFLEATPFIESKINVFKTYLSLLTGFFLTVFVVIVKGPYLVFPKKAITVPSNI